MGPNGTIVRSQHDGQPLRNPVIIQNRGNHYYTIHMVVYLL